MQITLDTDQLSEKDLNVLRALVGDSSPASAAQPAKKAAAPAKKAAAAPEPEETPAETSGEPTMEDAVARATELVSSGKATEVKAALDACGADRVSNLPGDKIGDFLAALG